MCIICPCINTALPTFDECCRKIDLVRVQTGLYITYYGGNAVRYIKQRSYFLKCGRISSYFDIRYTTVLQIEKQMHIFEDQKIANFLNFELVNFPVILFIIIKSVFNGRVKTDISRWTFWLTCYSAGQKFRTIISWILCDPPWGGGRTMKKVKYEYAEL